MTWKDDYYSRSGYTYASWTFSVGQGNVYIFFANATYDTTLCNHPIPRLTLSGGIYGRSTRDVISGCTSDADSFTCTSFTASSFEP